MGMRRKSWIEREWIGIAVPAKNPHAQALGKLGGQSKSEAKAAAARENGKKGGKPRKQQNIADISKQTA